MWVGHLGSRHSDQSHPEEQRDMYALLLLLSLCRPQWPAPRSGGAGGSHGDGADLHWSEECRQEAGPVLLCHHQVCSLIPQQPPRLPTTLSIPTTTRKPTLDFNAGRVRDRSLITFIKMSVKTISQTRYNATVQLKGPPWPVGHSLVTNWWNSLNSNGSLWDPENLRSNSLPFLSLQIKMRDISTEGSLWQKPGSLPVLSWIVILEILFPICLCRAKPSTSANLS